MKFLDEAKIFIKAGDGGKGCISFRRELYCPKGGPNGGNGGKGGDIVIRCVANLNTLIDYRYRQHFKASSGEAGKGSNCNGKNGNPEILYVPEGTQIYAEDGETLIFDFTTEGQEYVIIEGGRGGIGNAAFKSSVNKAPRYSTPGEIGMEMNICLRLKLISNAGLVGLPNAGKSTFLSRVTSARPKIADYPFTTLKPQLGVVFLEEEEFVLADIPGLIEGASENIGLGHKFLKHVERCGILIHLIDATNDNINEAYKIIRNELHKYGLGDKEEIIVLNKIDAIEVKELKKKKINLQKVVGKNNIIYEISTISGENINDVLYLLKKKIFQ